MTSNLFGKAWGSLILLLTTVWAVYLGMDLQKNDWREAIVDGILLAFWLFTAVFLHYMALREVKQDFEAAQRKKDFDNQLKNMFSGKDLLSEILGEDHKGHDHKVVKVGKLENAKHEELAATFDAIMEEVSRDKEPTAKHLAEIKKQFEAKTGHEVKLTNLPIGLSVQIGREPMAKTPAKKAPVTKKPVAKKAPVTKKPVTKKGK